MAQQKKDNVQIHHIELSKIKTDPSQPRSHFDPEALDKLAESIKSHGVLQPIIVRKDKNNIVLVSGERRYRAAKKLKEPTIPAIYHEGNPTEIALIENIIRQDLTVIEEAEAIRKLYDDSDYNHEDLARILDKGRTTITEMLSLTKLPEDVLEECRKSHKYARRVLVLIARQENETKMRAEFERYKKRLEKDEKIGETNTRPRNIIANTAKSISALNNKIEKNINTFKEQKDEVLKQELIKLRNFIDNLLNE